MSRFNSTVCLLMAVMVVAGCSRAGDERSARAEARIKECEDRLSAIEKSSREISDKLDSLVSAKPWVSEVDNKLVNATVAMHEEVEAMVPEVVERVLDEREAREEEARAEQRAKRREDAVEQMQKWEQQEMDRMAEAVGLDEAQKEKMKVAADQTRQLVQQKTREVVEQMRNGGNFDPQSIQNAVDEVMNAQDESIKQFLSAEQFDKYVKYREDTLGRWTGLMNRVQPGARSVRPEDQGQGTAPDAGDVPAVDVVPGAEPGGAE